VGKDKADLLQGTLDLLVLKTLETMGTLHGWGIAKRIEQISEDLLEMKYGTLYPALMRLEQQGWISSEWGTSENNRRARFYSITRQGRKQLALEAENWEQMAAFIARVTTSSDVMPRAGSRTTRRTPLCGRAVPLGRPVEPEV
jgi:transcriptional regulator